MPPERLATFRARVRHLQRLGILPSSPGRGQRISYSIFDAVKWALCFELAELELGPELMERLLVMPLLMFGVILHLPGAQQEDMIFWLRGELFSKYLARDGSYGQIMSGVEPMSRVAGVVFGDDEPLNIIRLEPADTELKKDHLAAVRAGRALMLNLTKLKRDLGKALKIKWDHDPKGLQEAFEKALKFSIPIVGIPPILGAPERFRAPPPFIMPLRSPTENDDD